MTYDMEETSQRPVLHVAAGQDLSDVIVRLIRDHCGMKGCTIKEIQKLILGTYEVEISDDLDLCRMILISCQKSIRHGRLFRHGCKFRVSFSELSLDPPLSNGATLVAEKSSGGEKVSEVSVCTVRVLDEDFAQGLWMTMRDLWILTQLFLFDFG